MLPEGERSFNPPRIVEEAGKQAGDRTTAEKKKSIAGGSNDVSVPKKAREKAERENPRLGAMVGLWKEKKGLIESFAKDISSTGKVSLESEKGMNSLRRLLTEFYEKDGKEPKEADRLAQGDIASAYLEAEEKAKKIKSEAGRPKPSKPQAGPGSQGEDHISTSESAGAQESEKTKVQEARVQEKEKEERGGAEKTALDEFQAANQPLWNELFNAYSGNYSASRAGEKIGPDAVRATQRLENQVKNYFIREGKKSVSDAHRFASAVAEHLKGLVRDAYASERREELRRRAGPVSVAGPRDAYRDEEYEELIRMQAARAKPETAASVAAKSPEEKTPAAEASPAAETPLVPEERKKIERLRKAVAYFREHLPSMFPKEGAGYAFLEEEYAEQLNLQTTAYARGAYRKLGLPPEAERETIRGILPPK